MDRRSIFPAWLLLLALVALARSVSVAEEYDGVYGSGPNAIVVATGSPGELGLLEALSNAYSNRHKGIVRWKKAGSGQALALLKAEKVDVVLIHAPEAERRAVAEGWAIGSTLVGSNEYYIVGPRDDPAQVSTAKTAADAYRRIASAKARFLSRGDNSGTQQKETALWRQAGITPSGDWYVVTADFMLATLRRANRENAYFMTDSSTWIAARANLPNLKVVFQGDPLLVNVYHALRRPEGSIRGGASAAEFVDFLRSEDGQGVIRDFGKERYGAPLYQDAARTKAFNAR